MYQFCTQDLTQEAGKYYARMVARRNIGIPMHMSVCIFTSWCWGAAILLKENAQCVNRRKKRGKGEMTADKGARNIPSATFYEEHYPVE